MPLCSYLTLWIQDDPSTFGPEVELGYNLPQFAELSTFSDSVWIHMVTVGSAGQIKNRGKRLGDPSLTGVYSRDNHFEEERGSSYVTSD